MRTRTAYKVYRLTEKTCEKFEIDAECITFQRRKSRVPTRISSAVVTENIRLIDDDDLHSNQENYIRKEIYIPIADKAITEMKRRFSSDNVEVLTGICVFNPKSPLFLNYDALKPFAKHYKSNLQDCELEIKQLLRLCNRKKENGTFTCCTLLDMLSFINKYEDAFYKAKRLIHIAGTIPVSSSEAERSFSSLKLIKNHLRTTMTDARLSSIAVISVHKERAKKIDLDRVIDHFISAYPNCRITLK